MSNQVDKYLQEAINNIRDDRAVTSKLLIEIMNYINVEDIRHQEVGAIAAKYVETLQRSNEQLVKLTSILSKKQDSSLSLDDKDKNDLFDIIQGEANSDR